MSWCCHNLLPIKSLNNFRFSFLYKQIPFLFLIQEHSPTQSNWYSLWHYRISAIILHWIYAVKKKHEYNGLPRLLFWVKENEQNLFSWSLVSYELGPESVCPVTINLFQAETYPGEIVVTCELQESPMKKKVRSPCSPSYKTATPTFTQ